MRINYPLRSLFTFMFIFPKVLLEVISSLIAELAYYVGLLESPTFMNELMFCIADNVDFSKYAEKVFPIA